MWFVGIDSDVKTTDIIKKKEVLSQDFNACNLYFIKSYIQY